MKGLGKNMRSRKRKSVLTRIWHKALGILLIFGIPLLLFGFTFQLKKINVQGTEQVTADEVKTALVQTKFDSNTILFYLKNKFYADTKIPFVEKIDVGYKDNHTVNVYVYEKKVIGCVKFMGEYLYFDKDGIIVESSSKQLKNIPEIKGLQFSKVILNEKLVVQKDELFNVILNITQLIDKYKLKVSTISFNSKYEVTIDCGDNTILLGKRSTYDEALSELKNMLPKAKGMSLTIDMRDFVPGTDMIPAKPKKPTK